MSTIITSAGQPVTLRAIKVNPWARRVEAIELPTREIACGCATADGVEMARLLGRQQTAHPVLDGEVLIVGVDVVGPAWTWGSMRCRGLGLILGDDWRHSFDDARSSLSDVRECVRWQRRRVTAAAA